MKVNDILVERLRDVTKEDLFRFLSSNVDPEFDAAEMRNFDKAVRKLRPWVKQKVIIFRGVATVGDPTDKLNKINRIGTSWTYDQDSAKVFRDSTRGFGDHYILVSEVGQKDIDWLATVALNTIPVRGDFENEIRLKTGRTIKVIDIFDDNLKPILPLGDPREHVLDKRYKT